MFAQELSDKNQAPKHTATCCDEIGVWIDPAEIFVGLKHSKCGFTLW